MKDKTKKIICIQLEKLSKSYESSLETEKKNGYASALLFYGGKRVNVQRHTPFSPLHPVRTQHTTCSVHTHTRQHSGKTLTKVTSTDHKQSSALYWTLQMT